MSCQIFTSNVSGFRVMRRLRIQKCFLAPAAVYVASITVWISTLAALGVGHAIADETPDRPNILWIVAENFALDFGCYGVKNVHTPHIDLLAAVGIRYTNVFSTSPVCAPSRSTFMTGMYATSIDMHHMRSHREDDFRLPEGIRPITHRLHDAGYMSANIKTIRGRTVGTGKLDLNFVNEGELYTTDEWSKLKTNQPFFAQINMPEAEYDIYDRKSAEKARVPWVGEQWHPQIATPDNVTLPPYYPDHQIVREEWARFLNSASGMDVRIGWILDALKEDGIADNTVVILFADNGRLEARGIHWCFDSGLHVPLIVRWPQGVSKSLGDEPGSVNDSVISLLDLTATTLSIAGIERPTTMQSRVFLGENRDPGRTFAFSARDRIDETVVRQRSVRGRRYHYVRNFTPGAGFPTLNRYKEKCFLVKPLMRKLLSQGRLVGPPLTLMQPFPREQFFDTELDPFETDNLVDSTHFEHRLVLAQMRTALDTWMVETGDRGYLVEPEEVVAPFVKEMHDWFGTPKWAEQ